MKFEHLIEINDPLNPLIDSLTREQLWRGLVLRAESTQAVHAPPGRMHHQRTREPAASAAACRFGELVIDDRVILTPLQEVRYEVPAQGEIAASRLTMTIEAPGEGVLCVRFRYDDGHDVRHRRTANAMYEEFKKSAYQEADIDTIKHRARSWRREGQAGRDAI